jgi:hypothetical protein
MMVMRTVVMMTVAMTALVIMMVMMALVMIKVQISVPLRCYANVDTSQRLKIRDDLQNASFF